MTQSFSPDWTSPPGWIVEELRGERRISLHDLAGMIGLTVPEVLELEGGSFQLDPLLAERLEYVFGISEATWLSLEENYRKDLTKGLKVSK
jgi:HTH-type transcriptional regulator/antitoxin HigA